MTALHLDDETSARDAALRKADLAMDAIDRALAAPSHPHIDDLVHHPGQQIVDIAGWEWFHIYAYENRGPSGRVRYTDTVATRLADNACRSEHDRQQTVRRYLDNGTHRACWHCCLVVNVARWSRVDGDDVCARCRDRIDSWKDEKGAAVAATIALDRHERRAAEGQRWDDPDGVDGVTIARQGSGGGFGVVNPRHSI